MIRTIESYVNTLLDEIEDVSEALGNDGGRLEVLRLQIDGIREYINQSFSKLDEDIGGLLHENITILGELSELVESGYIDNWNLSNNFKDLAAANKQLLEDITYE